MLKHASNILFFGMLGTRQVQAYATNYIPAIECDDGKLAGTYCGLNPKPKECMGWRTTTFSKVQNIPIFFYQDDKEFGYLVHVALLGNRILFTARREKISTLPAAIAVVVSHLH